MRSVISRFFQDETGATVVEYGLIVAALALLIVAAFPTLNGALDDLFGRMEDDMDNSATVLAPS